MKKDLKSLQGQQKLYLSVFCIILKNYQFFVDKKTNQDLLNLD